MTYAARICRHHLGWCKRQNYMPFAKHRIISSACEKQLPFAWRSQYLAPRSATFDVSHRHRFATASTSPQRQSVLPSLSVHPRSSLADEDFDIRVSGLRSGQEIGLEAKVWSECGRYGFKSRAVYKADSNGDISVKSDPSLGGSYEGVEPHGLIWGLEPLPDVADKYPRFVKYDVTTPFEFVIDLLELGGGGDEGKVLASTTMKKWYLADYVERIPVKMGRAEGVWFIPKEKGSSDPLPVVLDVRGIVSSLVVDRGAILSSHGFAVFAYDYYHPVKRQANIDDMLYLDLETFEDIIEFIRDHPRLDANRIGLTCNCIGGALSLHAVSKLQLPIRCLVAMGYIDILLPSFGLKLKDGKLIEPYTRYTFEYWQDDDGRWWIRNDKRLWTTVQEDDEQVAQVENIDCPMLLFEHGDEDHLQVRLRTKVIKEKMKTAGKGHLVETIFLSGTGHFPDTPYLPKSPISKILIPMPGEEQLFFTAYGGYDAKRNAQDQAFGWRQILAFFRQHLEPRETYRNDWM